MCSRAERLPAAAGRPWRAGSVQRLIVHVGMSKTGSTSIQRMLIRRRESLRAGGVHVPRAGLSPAGKHLLVGRKSRRPKTEHWTLLAQELRGAAAGDPAAELTNPCAGNPAARFVISAEEFTQPAYRAATAARLAELAERENLKVDIVGYVRPQWQFLESVYSQRVYGLHLGATFDRFVADMLEAGERSELDYNVVFAPYRAQFGARVRVFPLEPSRLPGGLLAHFLGQCGIHDGQALAAGPARANPRRNAKSTEVRRLVVAQVDRRRKAALERPPFRPNRLAQLPSLIDGDEPFSGFDHSRIRELQARFADANARFAREYGIDVDGVLFRDPVDLDARRPTVAQWRDFGAAERRRVRRYVLERTGIDLDPDAGDPASRWPVRVRILKGWLCAVARTEPAEGVEMLRRWWRKVLRPGQQKVGGDAPRKLRVRRRGA